jgi:integrase
MGDFARRRYQLEDERPTITFAKYRDWYYEHISSTKRNQPREASMLRQLGAYFDPLELHTLERDQIMAWRTARAKAVAPGTVNREMEILKHLLGSAVPKYLATNPASGVKPLRVPEVEVRLLEPEEERRLLLAATPEQMAIIICALDTLARLSSVAGLKRAQDHGTYITNLNPKVTGYKVPVSTRLRLALDALPADSVFCFQGVQGGNPAARATRVSLQFLALCQKVDIPTGRKDGGLSFHCLRHTGASRMLARGVDIETVRQIGGWTNLTVLRKYLHPTDEARRWAVESIGSLPSVNRA